ncbi:MAG: SCO family protein [Ktedonobacterales bacterium]
MQPSKNSRLRRFWQTLHLPALESIWPRRWNIRLWSISCAVLLLVLLGGLLALHLRSGSASAAGASELQGTDLGGVPSPAFSLPDQNGKVTSLAGFKGHPVVLTFFDSVCPHADCTLMASYIMATAKDLGAAQTSEVDWVALSLNPWHDTPATAKAFLSTRHVTIPLHFELGSLAQMAPLWSDYHMQSILQPDGIVIHTTGVYLIDQQGRERIFLDEGFDPQMLSNDVHLLLTNAQVANQKENGGSNQGLPAGYTSMSKTSSAGVVTLIASPGQYGTYTFEVDAWEADGIPADGTGTLDLTMTSMSMTPLHVPLSESADGSPGVYTAQGVLSMEGGWRAVVTITPGDGSTPIQETFNFNAFTS